MIYTSYFAYANRVPHPIAISGSVPPWYTGERYLDLAPRMNMVQDLKNGLISEREYTEQYLALLAERGITADKIKADLPEECTLLCWETRHAFCHRQIVAYILRKAGYEVKEWEPENVPKASKAKKRSKGKVEQS